MLFGARVLDATKFDLYALRNWIMFSFYFGRAAALRPTQSRSLFIISMNFEGARCGVSRARRTLDTRLIKITRRQQCDAFVDEIWAF